MSTEAIANPQASAPAESKSSKKKKGKAEAPLNAASADSSRPVSEPSIDSPEQVKLDGAESSTDSTYVKELHKNIRNVNKKLNAMQKVDSIVAENPGVSLDDLVASRKINNDQRAQALKKPALQAQLTQLEEQLAQYKKFDQEYQQKLTTEKELLQSSHKAELEKLRETLKAEAAIEAARTFKSRMLIFSRFLREAATRRQQDDGSDISKAFEGALVLVYGGDARAVVAAEQLIDGADEAVPSTEGTPLEVTFAQLKEALAEVHVEPDEAVAGDAPQPAQPDPTALDAAEDTTVPSTVPSTEPSAEPSTDPSTSTQPSTDPTIANAGLTEADDIVHIKKDMDENVEVPTVPPETSVGDGAANAAADKWDTKAPGSEGQLEESFEMVPRDPSEVETSPAAAANTSVQSWADDAANEAASTPEPTVTTNGNDGFHEVHHNRGGRGRGGFQGEHRGGYRGRGGPRGEGRGRGGHRGDRGGDGFRGGRGRGGFRGGRGGRDAPPQ